jgi:hypothetical protein
VLLDSLLIVIHGCWQECLVLCARG